MVFLQKETPFLIRKSLWVLKPQYYAISKEMMALYHSDDGIEKFYDNLSQLENTIYYCDLIKSWDVLHYPCTGFTSYNCHQPIDNIGFLDKIKSIFKHSSNDNKEIFATEKQKYLYYAFYGKNIPVTDSPSFNNYDDVVKIIEFLKEIDIEKIIKRLDYRKIPFDELYPKLSADDFNDDEFVSELIDFF